MELMSSAFLCVLVALLPQTLGNSRNKNALKVDVKLHNNSVLVLQNPMLRKAILLNINGPPLVGNNNELQSVFSDLACKTCSDCIERAIKAHYTHLHKTNSRPSLEELRDDTLMNEIYRTKRDTVVKSEITTELAPKKFKIKKNKLQKTTTVTKYNVDSEVYALKVKETQLSMEGQNNSRVPATCQVYNVKKSFPCDSPEGGALLSSARRKANKKKANKEQDKIIRSTTAKAHTSVFRKREVDNSQGPENFMSSIEDIY